MQLRKGSELLWPPMGSPVLHCDLLCVHSSGFAKKTFISYSVTFRESFRQGLVVEIDLKNQTVLLEDGEVSTAVLTHPSAVFRRPWKMRLLAGDLGRAPQGLRELSVAPEPPWVLSREQIPHKRGLSTATTGLWWQTFLEPVLYPGIVVSLMQSRVMPTVTLRGRWRSLTLLRDQVACPGSPSWSETQ